MSEKPNYSNSKLFFLRPILFHGLILSGILLLISRPYLLESVRASKVDAFWLLLGPSIILILFLLNLFLEFSTNLSSPKSLKDLAPHIFGIIFIAIIFPSSFREYRARELKSPADVALLQQLSKSKDARVRTLVIMAAQPQDLNIPELSALIHDGLLDKDPLVRNAAKLVIEEHFGIRLKNGTEGFLQASALIKNLSPQANLVGTASP